MDGSSTDPGYVKVVTGQTVHTTADIDTTVIDAIKKGIKETTLRDIRVNCVKLYQALVLINNAEEKAAGTGSTTDYRAFKTYLVPNSTNPEFAAYSKHAHAAALVQQFMLSLIGDHEGVTTKLKLTLQLYTLVVIQLLIVIIK